MRRAFAWLSCLICWIATRKWEPLCLYMARKHGPDCRFCRAVAAALGEPWHCRDLMRIDDVVAWLRQRSQ